MVNYKRVSKYRRKLFSNFFFLFIAFAITIAAFQYKREKEYRVEALQSELVTYTKLVHEFIDSKKLIENNNFRVLDSLNRIMPDSSIRITVINKDGAVKYDSFVKDFESLENHLLRPEVQESLRENVGVSMRFSNSTNRDYYYCSINFNDYFIRAAMPYDIQVENYLEVDMVFIYVIFLIFLIAAAALIYLSDRLGKTITKLQAFAAKAAAGEKIDTEVHFPDNELGMIGNQIVQVYNNLQKTRDQLRAEREKLFRHLQISHEGIAVFSKEKKQLLANNHFIQYLNSLSNDLAIAPNKVFKIEELEPINAFIDEQLERADLKGTAATLSSNMVTIHKNNKYFVVQAIIFNDLTFEISINDVTKLEKEKKLKQQMTSNIAHELKTPVSSILGYLETLMSVKVDKETRKFFIERSYVQSQRLTSLIQDISLLNKIEEASELFIIEEVDIRELVDTALDELRLKIQEKDITIKIDLAKQCVIKGNRSVFFSIWRNLIENAINYAGVGITISIKNYLEDDDFLYFSFSDNGTGIPEEHLTRVFERFYRVDSGRSRSMGGTGLGLAIVKNGVVFHKGEISVKNLNSGGLEFIFSICKDLNKQNIS